ncbi:hypothetical protein RG47T_3451 [Mucilaginibacter polytrichastri]|uniref:Uncharacterized protein n=1 Tax=Mucilaginibacter polytrichastri TaxID=1302689 RepID=A0A1Q6A1U3_9SPHI|nr:hypothetical protein RG47T_3451 [Mucilaginibacter polytrichastri]
MRFKTVLIVLMYHHSTVIIVATEIYGVDGPNFSGKLSVNLL